MGTLERYIFRQLIGPLGFFTLVLTGIVWLTQSLRILDVVVNTGQGARVLLEFSALLLPAVLAIVLQLGALIATVYALHRMIMESEITAALAGGASRARLARPVVFFGGALTILMFGITLYMMPTAARALNDRMAEVRGDVAAGLVRDGRFLTLTRGLTVYIREITPEGEMLGIMVKDSRGAEQDEAAQATIYTAKRGVVRPSQEASEAPILEMYEGQMLRPTDTQDLVRVGFTELSLKLDFFNSGTLRRRKASERYFWELIFPDPEEARNRKEVGRFVAEGHEQLSAPLYGLALPLVAAAAMLSAAFSRRGLGATVATALLAGAAVRVVGIAAKNSTTAAPELWPLMYAVPIAAIAAAVYMLSRSGMTAPSRGGSVRLGPASGPNDGGADGSGDVRGRGRPRAVMRPTERGGERYRT